MMTLKKSCQSTFFKSLFHCSKLRRKEAIQHPRCVGVGEIGLDYHYPSNSPPSVQRAVFRRLLKLAIQFKKTLVVHAREADTDVESILTELVPRDWKASAYNNTLALSKFTVCADTSSFF